MNLSGRKPDRHLIDGREMTGPEIASMLGVSYRAIQKRRSAMGGCSYQVIVDMYRQNQFGTKYDKWPRHLIHGKWMTIREAAAELGCHHHTLQNYRHMLTRRDGKKPTLEAAYDYYRYERRSPGGSVAKLYYVHGHKMTVAQAAEKYGTTVNALYRYMHKHRSTLETAVRRHEE